MEKLLKIDVVVANITKLDVECIVNAANPSLLGGGGVDGAIHFAAGRQLYEECKTLGGCEVGQCKISDAYKLPCKKIIHAVGPIWKGGTHDEDTLLASCYKSSLKIASEYGLKSIAFPNISTGVYRFPRERAAKIAIDSISECITNNIYEGNVIICCSSDGDADIYNKLLEG